MEPGLPSTLPEQRDNTSISSNHGQHLLIAYFVPGAILSYSYPSNEGVMFISILHITKLRHRDV